MVKRSKSGIVQRRLGNHDGCGSCAGSDERCIQARHLRGPTTGFFLQ